MTRRARRIAQLAPWADRTVSSAVLTAHSRAAVLLKGHHIADELAGKPCDPARGLGIADRLALTALALAVDAEASPLAGIEPVMPARAHPATALAQIEASA